MEWKHGKKRNDEAYMWAGDRHVWAGRLIWVGKVRMIEGGLLEIYICTWYSIFLFPQLFYKALLFKSECFFFKKNFSFYYPPTLYNPLHKKKTIAFCRFIQIKSQLSIMTTKPTSTLLRLLISIAITAGVQLVYAKPVPDNFQIDGFLQQQPQQQPQQQEQPNAGESFVVAYGGNNSPNYNLDSTDLNAAAQFGVSTSPTPTSQENPSPAEGDLVAWEWWDNSRNNVLADDSTLPEVTGDPATQKARAEEFQNFNCGNEESICCSGNHPAPAVSGGKHVCANSKFCSTHFFSWAVLANEFVQRRARLLCHSFVLVQCQPKTT